jgi:MoaA/NifB/PqqE/SkfB family radical SAM enzyme
MSELAAPFVRYLPGGMQTCDWRAFPLDGKLLLFDRDTGLNALLEGAETSHFRQIAPRCLLIAVTNACNMACDFCYRDRHARSLWSYESLLEFCRAADRWGVLEVAFGGGEPLLFPRWDDFVCELYATTRLAINFTTNGTLLNGAMLQRIAGSYGQIRLSLYADNDWPGTIRLLTESGVRFGVNWLVTPADLDRIDATFERLLALGVRDVLLIRYKGTDPARHLTPAHCRVLAAFVNRAHRQAGSAVQIKLDACWGAALPEVPRLFAVSDCGAGDEILAITSDRRVKPCSFFHVGVPFETVDDVRAFWVQRRASREAARMGGCGRLPGQGIGEQGDDHEDVDLAAI